MGFSLQIFHDTLGAALAAPERAFGQLFNLSTGSVAPTTGMLKLALEAKDLLFGLDRGLQRRGFRRQFPP